MKLDKALINKVQAAVQRTWNYIGCESAQLAQECGESLTNVAAMEGCIDAGRLTFVAKDVEAEQLVGAAIDEHGWDKTVRYLSRHIRLV